jgi:glyoxylase-like metal-dependent hydrolase (beta-lactamase superfamily II)
VGAETITVGNVEIMPVLDASAMAPCAALFPTITDEQWSHHKEHLSDDLKLLPMSIASFVVRSAGQTILVDTGIGAKNRPFFPQGRLPDALREAGVPPESIDVVLATHIHIDHVGWHTTAQGDNYVPTFPQAKHIFNLEEWNYFTQPDVMKQPMMEHISDCVIPLDGKVAIELLDVGTEHRLNDDITLVGTPGHTPAHMSIAIASAGEAAIIWGDVCHHPAQVTELWSPVFDMNPTLAQATRESVLERVERERTLVLAGHFPFPGMGRVVKVDGKRYWRAGRD